MNDEQHMLDRKPKSFCTGERIKIFFVLVGSAAYIAIPMYIAYNRIALAVPCAAQWEGSPWYGKGTQDILKDAVFSGFLFFVGAATVCCYLDRSTAWRQQGENAVKAVKTEQPDSKASPPERFFHDLCWAVKGFTYSVCMVGFYWYMRYYIVLPCSRTWSWVLPLADFLGGCSSFLSKSVY